MASRGILQRTGNRSCTCFHPRLRSLLFFRTPARAGARTKTIWLPSPSRGKRRLEESKCRYFRHGKPNRLSDRLFVIANPIPVSLGGWRGMVRRKEGGRMHSHSQSPYPLCTRVLHMLVASSPIPCARIASVRGAPLTLQLPWAGHRK
jgi:hypothetical protein